MEQFLAPAHLDITQVFPGIVDSSMLTAYKSCQYKFYLTYIEHWKPKFESIHLVAGGAFAKGIEMARKAFYEQGKDAAESEAIGLAALISSYGDFQGPEGSVKSLDRMVGTLEFYLSNYPLGADGAEPITMSGGRRGIEFSFLEALDFRHPATGDPILYSGRSDMIASFAGGLYHFDEKTTSQLGAKWADQWDLRSQFTAYCWAGKRNGIEAQGAVVRGVSILKNKYETAQAITYRSDWEIEQWEELTYHLLEGMLTTWKAAKYRKNFDGSCTRSGNPWDRNLDVACNDYSGCPFRKVCKSRHPYEILETEFERRVWDPTRHKEIPIREWEEEFR
jgi:hypothetical protein